MVKLCKLNVRDLLHVLLVSKGWLEVLHQYVSFCLDCEFLIPRVMPGAIWVGSCFVYQVFLTKNKNFTATYSPVSETELPQYLVQTIGCSDEELAIGFTT